MPSWLSHCLENLRLHSQPRGSRSPKLPAHLDVIDASSSPGLVVSPASSARSGVSEENLNVATGIHPPSSPAIPINAPRSSGGFTDKASSDSTNPSARASHLVIPIGATHPPRSSCYADIAEAQQLLVPQDSPHSHPMSSEQSLSSEHLVQSSSQPRWQNQGMFNHARDFSLTGNFIDINGNVGNVTLMNNASTSGQKFMKELLKQTIPGAASDSSARDPPPRCLPGTRLAILKRCRDFVNDCSGTRKIRWVVGAAGVGKSAIMQNVAESPLPVTSNASVFFSFNGRSDGTKTFITLCYQLAAKSEPYRLFIENEIDRDPSLFHSSMSVQFKKFFVEPFILNPSLNCAGRVLIVLDGLDECDNPRTQQELLRLISDFCIKYPSSSIVWLIASRPEPHITSFFSKLKVMPAYEKEEIPVDSDEARADVERFLRYEFAEIKEASDSLALYSEWPKEQDLWTITNASGGLFAHADTVIRYIGDPIIGNPASQLSDVLNVIDKHPMPDVPPEEHPMALLDALYARILSNIPSKNLANARMLLLSLASDWDRLLYGQGSFIVLCNWLGMTCDDAYAAINNLRSVLYAPRLDKAHQGGLKPFHKSFIDYISNFTRSGFSTDIKLEIRQLKSKCLLRILQEVHDEPHFEGMDGLSYGPNTGDNISLTWSIDQSAEVDSNDNATRRMIYNLAFGEGVTGIRSGDPIFLNGFCVRLLTTRKKMHTYVTYDELCDLVFDESRRDEFMGCNVLKQVPLMMVDFSKTRFDIGLWCRCPAKADMINISNQPNSSGEEGSQDEWEGGNDQDGIPPFTLCTSTSSRERFRIRLESLKARYPDYIVLVLFNSSGQCCVELQFVDSGDDASEWTYRFWCDMSIEERKKYGSEV